MSTPNVPKPVEDPSAQLHATREAYDALAQALGLPPVRELANQPVQAGVRARLLTELQRIRGRIDADLPEQFHQSVERNKSSLADEVVMLAGTEADGIRYADGLLRTLNEYVDPAEIRKMAANIADIRLDSGTRLWEGNVGGSNLEINIDSWMWSRGPAEIENYLKTHTNVTFAQAGIRVLTRPLNAATPVSTHLKDILALSNDIVAPTVPRGAIDVQHVGTGYRSTVDLGLMLRSTPTPPTPTFAQMTDGDLITYFSNAAHALEFMRFFRTVDASGSPVAYAAAIVAPAINSLYSTVGRTPGGRLSIESSSLKDALDHRASVNQLFDGAADGREVLLALGIASKNPNALSAIHMHASKNVEEINKKIEKNNELQNAAETIKLLKDLDKPEFEETEIVAKTDLLKKYNQNVISGFRFELGALAPITAPNRRSVNFLIGTPWGGADLSGNAGDLTTLGLPHGMSVVVARDSAKEVKSDNEDQFKDVVKQSSELMEKYKHARINRQKIADKAMSQIARILTKKKIASLTAYPKLDQYFSGTLIGGVMVYRVKADEIKEDLNNDIDQLEEEYGQVLGEKINTVDQYKQQAGTLQTELQEEKKKAKGEKLVTGSEACWAVIRAGLLEQLRDTQAVENTVAYLQTRLKLTPAVQKDIAALSEGWRRDRDLGKAERSHRKAEKEWKKAGRTYHAILKGGKSFDTWGNYRSSLNRLMEEEFHLDFDTNLRNGSVQSLDIEDLRRAFFFVKYLYKVAPKEDKRRLPPSPEILDYLTNLREAIIRRTLEERNLATGSSDRNLRALEDMKIDPTKTPPMTDREVVRLVRSSLNDDKAFYETEGHKEWIEAMADEAYKPIQEKIESHERWKQRWKGEGSIFNVVSIPAKLLGLTKAVGLAKLGSSEASMFNLGWNGSRLNPLTWPAKLTYTIPNWIVGNGAWYNPVALSGKVVRGTTRFTYNAVKNNVGEGVIAGALGLGAYGALYGASAALGPAGWILGGAALGTMLASELIKHRTRRSHAAPAARLAHP